MGQVTSNISIYIPSDGETLYGQSFAQGMLNIDQHDHSGPPTKGVPLSSSGLADYSVTAIKLNNTQPTSVVAATGGLGFNGAPNQLTTEGLLLALYGVSTIGFLSQTANGPVTAASRTLIGTSGDASTTLVNITNPQGVAGDPSFSVPQSFLNKLPVVIKMQVLDTPGAGTYTPSTGMVYCMVEVLGGGGGGGGVANGSAAGFGTSGSGGGGGAGGYSRGVFTAAQVLAAGYSVNVGAGGTGAVTGGNTGGTGGTTSFGTAALIQATGGLGGTFTAPEAAGGVYGGAGGQGSLGILNMKGNWGGMGIITNASGSNLGVCGQGGIGFFGGVNTQDFENNTAQTDGAPAISYGCGGNGGCNVKNGGTAAGGAGFKGVIVITEYCNQ